jgi:hypothetical protein
MSSGHDDLERQLTQHRYKARVVTLYRVWEETEKNEGRGGRVIVGHALDRPVAEAHASDKGVMGYPTEVTEHRAVEFRPAFDDPRITEPRFYVLLDDVASVDDILKERHG